MTDEYEYTRDLDLLGDWLDAKGYTEEAGLITRSMDFMHKQAALIAELEDELKVAVSIHKNLEARIAELEAALKPFADHADKINHELISAKTVFDARKGHTLYYGDLRAARAALEKKND
jgi:hypothetical protein